MTQLVTRKQVTAIQFGGQIALLDSRGILYFPAFDSLVVSDLHFEKASYLAAYANPVAQLDTRATLKRLAAVLGQYQPSEVICLGDSFHDAHGYNRMLAEDKANLAQLVTGCSRWCWVLGNHDPAIPVAAGGEQTMAVHRQDMVFQHEPENDETSFQVVGHFHPKSHLTVASRRYQGKCFVHNGHTLIMPAFGQYTGGLSIDSEVIKNLINPVSRHVYLIYQDRIYQV
nr:ligase-associated DNA damage response endonuclease PdeM [Alteromonas sp. C1M14]